MLRYGVLGLLIDRRGYGYELVQRLASRLGSAWQLNPSAVYAALDQLEDDGLIEAAPSLSAVSTTAAPSEASHSVARKAPARERRSSRRSQGRVVYQPTDLGIREFNAWLARPSARLDPIRSELALKVALACPDNAPPLLSSIAHEERLLVQSLHEECHTDASPLVTAAATTRLQGELSWLETVRETLQTMLLDNVVAAAVANPLPLG